jgi:carbon-monoxide dehydrogenase medium subunit
MIPTRTAYTRARSLDEALAALADGARPIAGGMSLVPMMKLRLANPGSLVDLGGLADLRGIHRDGGDLVIGAMARHRDVATSVLVRAEAAAVADAAGGVGSPAVRNRGTIGGSLAQSDPHGDLPATVLALGGSIEVRSASGGRTIAAADLSAGYMTTSLAEGELIVAVRIPAGARQSAYAKFHRRAIDWSIAGAAAVIRDGKVTVALTGMGSGPLRATAFESLVNDGGSLEDAARHAGDGTHPSEGLDGSAEYKRHLAGVLARRATETARSR